MAPQFDHDLLLHARIADQVVQPLEEQEAAAALRRLEPSDPVRYDFSLCHIGMMGACGYAQPQRDSQCPLRGVCAPRARRAHTSLAVRVSVRRVLVHSGTGYAAHLLRCPSADRHSAMTHPIIPGAEPWSHVATDGAPGALCIHGFTGNPGSMRELANACAAAGFHVELPQLADDSGH